MKPTYRKGSLLLAVTLLFAMSSVMAGDWPQWRGPNRDNHVTGFKAPTNWPKSLTKKWTATVGAGEASPLLMSDKVFTFGRIGGDEVALCFDAATGKELWRDKNAAAKVTGPDGGYPGPRATPAAGEGKVCTFGVHGVLSCLDAATGKVVWRKDTGTVPRFHTSSSPLIVDGKCIVFAGSLAAYDLANGEVKWKYSGNAAPYGSPVLMTVGGVKQVVTPSSGDLVGVSLDEGKPLWKVKIGSGGFDYQSSYSTPLIDGQNVYYFVAAKAGGKGGKVKGGGGAAGSSFALKIEKSDGGFKATELWKKNFTAHGYHTPVLRDGMIFGVSLTGRNFFCMDAKTGDELWKDKTQRGECGSILDVGSALVALTSDQNLIAFKPSKKEYTEVAKYQVGEAPTWCVPILDGNRVFVKDKGGTLTLLTVE
jgi:outer membrane protein assembly factor BamB